MAEIDDLRKQLEDLNKQIKEAGGLGIDFDEAIKRAGTDVKILQTYIAQLNKQLNDTINNSEYIYRTFQDLTSELKNQNLLLKAGKNSFKVFTDIAQDLNYYQKGTNDLTDKQFNRIKQNIGLEKEELKFVVDRLKASEKSRIAEAKNLSDALIKGELDGKQKTFAESRLKELSKENELLINANEALASGLPILEKELDLSQKISDSRKELGGATKAAADLLSKYGGSLAQFFNISDASKAVEDYNKDLIKSALQDKGLQNELLGIEKEKLDIGKKLEENLKIIHNSNRTLDTKERIASILQATAQEDLNKLDQKQVDLKNEAINKTVTLGNKYKSLTVFADELGKGLTKALEDPIVRLTIGLKLLKSAFNDIKAGFNAWKEFNINTTSVARSLGFAEESIRVLIRSSIASQASFGENVYSAKQIGQALSDVNEQLGVSLDISQDTLYEFSQMTQTMGLSAEEASKIYKLSVLNNQSLKNTNKSIAEGIVAAQKSTGIKINEKQVFQEIGKLSAGITAKFQQNPKALAEAVVQAKALGTNLETIDKIGDSLLNWESSIENQLKAQLITGKQLNLEKARYAALTGDQISLEKEIANQVGSLADFQSMNVIAQKSLAEAFGLSKDELADMLQKQEVFNKLGDISGKTSAEQLAIARERGLSESDSLVKNLQQQAAAEKIAAAFDNVKSTIASIVDGPLGTMVGFIAKMLNSVGGIAVVIGVTLVSSLAKALIGFSQLIQAAKILKMQEIGTAIAKAATAVFSNPAVQLTAGIAGVAILGGLVAAIYSAVNSSSNANDFKSIGESSGGHGKRMLLTPEGTFKINNKDTIIGGTDKSFNAVSPSISLNNPTSPISNYGIPKEDINKPYTPIANYGIPKETINKPTIPMANYGITKEDMKETINDLLSGILGRPQPAPTFIFQGNGAELGKFVGSQQETGTAQNIYTGYKVA